MSTLCLFSSAYRRRTSALLASRIRRRSEGWDHAHLLKDPDLIEFVPRLDEHPVGNAEDPVRRPVDRLAGRREAIEVAGVHPIGMDPDRHLIAFDEDLVDRERQVAEGLVEHVVGGHDPFDARWQVRHLGRVVIVEIDREHFAQRGWIVVVHAVDVAVDHRRVALDPLLLAWVLDRPELHHHAQDIDPAPALHVLAIDDPDGLHQEDGVLLPGRGHPHQVAIVGAGDRRDGRQLVTLADQVMDGVLRVGRAFEEHGEEHRRPGRTRRHVGRGVVVDAVRRDVVGKTVRDVVIDDVLDLASDQRPVLVFLDTHRSYLIDLGRRLILDPQLRSQLHQVDEGPSFDDLVAGDPIGLDRPDRERLAGRLRSHERPRVVPDRTSRQTTKSSSPVRSAMVSVKSGKAAK